jgi:hypothetical protein
MENGDFTKIYFTGFEKEKVQDSKKEKVQDSNEKALNPFMHSKMQFKP